MNGVVAFSCVVIVDDRAVVSNFVAGRPPTDNVFVGVDTLVQLIDVLRVAELGLDKVIVLFVGNAEAVCYFYNPFVCCT